jgi:transposase
MKKFIEYNQHQGLALPPYLDELIEERHLVRVVNDLVDQINLEILSKGFQSINPKNGGAPPYHPSMMMKVLIYSYATGIRSCRQIASQLKSNIHYMWLSGMQYPDFRYFGRNICKICYVIRKEEVGRLQDSICRWHQTISR